MSNLKYLGAMLILALGPFTIRVADSAENPVVTPLMLKDLADIPGKEVLMITVEYPPEVPIQSIVTMLTHSFTSRRAPS